MEIWIKAQVERIEGKQESAESVGEELVAAIEGESLDVEDSQFEVTSAEAVAGPKSRSAVNPDKILLALDAVFATMAEEHPMNLDGPGAPLTRTEQALAVLRGSPQVGEAIVGARERYYKSRQGAKT